MGLDALLSLGLAFGGAVLLPVWLRAAPALRPRTCRLVRPRISE